MKKEKTQEQKQPRRLRLSRETIRLLNDPALLGLARGGALSGGTCNLDTCTCPDPVTDSCVNRNCNATTCSGERGTAGTGAA